MSTFASRVFVALGEFNGHLATLTDRVKATPPNPPSLPRKALDELLEIGERARKASDAIAQSFTLIGVTALDIVDMQFRLKGEAAKLASALAALEEAIEKQHVVRERFDDALFGLRDASQFVGAAIFPSAVAGLLEVNEKLWQFQRSSRCATTRSLRTSSGVPASKPHSSWRSRRSPTTSKRRSTRSTRC